MARATCVQFEWLATGRGEMRMTHEQRDETVGAALGMLVDDTLEMRLVRAYRGVPVRARMPLVEVAEAMCTNRPDGKRQRKS